MSAIDVVGGARSRRRIARKVIVATNHISNPNPAYIISIALDFRSGNEDPYPSSVQDINYAVRSASQVREHHEWVRTMADRDAPCLGGAVSGRPV
jgi:hypothetical protein